MRKKLIAFCFLIVIGVVPNCKAQKSDVGAWFAYMGNQKINNKWNWHNEVQYRNFNFAGDLEQLMLRTGIGYNISESNNNVLLGYAYVHSEPYIAGTDEKIKTDEHRIFQQFLTKQQFGRVSISHRYRFEQRFIPDNFKMRLRYALLLNVPINKKEMDKNTFYASFSNEVFVNTKQNYYDRDRVYGGIGYCFNKNLKVEAGAMSQILPSGSRTQFQFTLFNSIPF